MIVSYIMKIILKLQKKKKIGPHKPFRLKA